MSNTLALVQTTMLGCLVLLLIGVAACSKSPDPVLTPPGAPSAVDLTSDLPTGLAANLSLKDRVAQLEKSGQIPALDRTDSLLGTDANNNGLRDDIET